MKISTGVVRYDCDIAKSSQPATAHKAKMADPLAGFPLLLLLS